MNRIARAMIPFASVVAVIGWGSQALSQNRGSVKSSLLLLIDASGSMGDEIGSGGSGGAGRSGTLAPAARLVLLRGRERIGRTDWEEA